MINCPNKFPCGWCAKFDKACENITKSNSINQKDVLNLLDWIDEALIRKLNKSGGTNAYSSYQNCSRDIEIIRKAIAEFED